MHCIIARAWPAKVSEPLITPLLYKAAATEVRRGIELSPCSIVACPSGTIYTSLWPHLCILCIDLRSGTSVGWPLDRVRICISDDTTAGTAGMDASIRLYFRCCQPPFEGGLWLRSYLRRHRGTMVCRCFCLLFVGTQRD